ncbi:cation-translocating P-type ATPase [Streptomyces piniterrae]|uniref:Cation-translocating P-type ATPase n=1 Tax=Streptomyces piniterrae TaxID=2571125 RepID=A0A4U0MU63_9ACTN|nr:cation-translocating P-type ATPase [Streptomyces piniterrae]TJZ44527.1 cation-translocating P-type ATPase [Streptomyces piniterrae]
MRVPAAGAWGAVLGLPIAVARVASTLVVGGAVTGATASVRIAARAGGQALEVASGTARAAGAALPRTGWSAVRGVVEGQVQAAERAAGALRDLAHGERPRRVWARSGRAHIQAHGLSGNGDRHHRYVRALTRALHRIEGVRWAEVNAVTGHVLIAYAEGSVGLESLVATVEAVEEAHGAHRVAESADGRHPDDDLAVSAAAVALAADCLGVGTALLGRLTALPAVPSPVRALVALADALPQARQQWERRIGRTRTDVLFAVVNAAVHGTSSGATPLAVDAAYRGFQLYEILARRRAWNLRERELVVRGGAAQPQECPGRARRPCPLPPGPVEKAADRTALGQLLGGAAVLLRTGDPVAAGDAVLATVPKAAGLGREAFATVLGHDLARRGVVALDPAALRRLDRIDAVVIDSSVLCNGELRLLSAVSTSDALDDAHVWRTASGLLADCGTAGLRGDGPWPRRDQRQDQVPDGESEGSRGSGPGVGTSSGWRLVRAHDALSGSGPSHPTGMTLDLVDHDGHRAGRVRVGTSLDPLAEAVLAAAHEAAPTVVLTQHASVAELLAWGDESAPEADRLTEQVQALQRDGHGVLAIAHDGQRALDAADVGVNVLRRLGATDWCADLVCGPGLAEVWRLLSAVPAARRAAARAAQLSLSGSALGALLVASRRRRRVRGPMRAVSAWHDLPPVHAACLTAMLANALTARRLDHRPLPPPVVRDAWHALGAHEVYRRLHHGRTTEAESDGPGATTAAPHGPVHRLAHRIVRRYGSDPLLDRAVITPVRGALRLAAAAQHELDDPLTPVLALGAAASAIVGSSVDALLVVGVMAGNAVISGAQRMRAERALGELMVGQQTTARRLRADEQRSVPLPLARLRHAPSERVPGESLRAGDLIALRANDVVPADARLLLTDALEVDEAALTGEPVPVEKTAEPVPGAEPADRSCIVYEGTTVLAGSGIAIVVATGAATEAGRAATVAGHVDAALGMQARLAELTRIALPATGVGGAVVTGLGLLRGLPLRRALESGVAVAVAAVPEGLPLVATVSQLAAARRLSRIGVLVRSTRALEALGRVDTLCFDKTGTLTEGRLRVTRLAGPSGPLPPGGPVGRQVLRTAARACPPTEGTALPLSHATDRAVVAAAHAAEDDTAWTLVEELPFETGRGYAASLGRDGDTAVLAVKGAPEVVLARCTRVPRPGQEDRPITDVRRRAAKHTVGRLAAQGLRVLAVAQRTVPDAELVRGRLAEHVDELTLLGFVGISDTPRPAADDTVRRLGEAGIRVVMITGDHPDTATAVAAELGIPDAQQVLTGAELDVLPAPDRIAAVGEAAVFARVSPAQKVRIIKDLRKAGRVVAMAGDGANDAAAIRRADVGIAVAGRGTGSARTAAGLVLTAAHTGLILDALREGRALWDSVRDAVAILVGGNAGEVAFTVLATALSGRTPLSTRQLLVVNMLTDMLPSLAVALTPAKRGERTGNQDVRPLGAGPARGFVGTDMARALAVRGGATALAALTAWQIGRLTRLVPGGTRRASTMGLAALVGTQLGQTLLTRWHSPLVLGTSAVSALALLTLVETPLVSQFFGCTPLGPFAWTVVACSATAATLAAALTSRVVTQN